MSKSFTKTTSGNKKGTQSKSTKATASPVVPKLPQATMRDLGQYENKKPPADIDTSPSGTPAGSRSSGGAAATYSSSGAGAPSASAGASAAAQESAPRRESVDYIPPETDGEARARYESAQARVEALQAQAPRYTSRYDEQIRALYEQITGRGAFRYDSATDPLYQQYRQSYIEQGRMAMRDTMGQAAALTGGYGSSYAQSVGAQQYDAYLRRLADVLPETYGMALEAWQAEGDELRGRYETAAALEKSDYERHLDELGQHNRELSLARDDAQSAYERMIDSDETAYSRAADDYARRLSADKLDYDRQQDTYSRLLSLMAAGYRPTAEEYAAAGLSSAQGEALRASLTATPAVSYRVVREKAEDKSTTKKSSSTKKGTGTVKKSSKG